MEINGKYSIIEVIGSGGMGVVYLAREPQRNRDVIIKIVTPDRLRQNPKIREQFTQEARIIGNLEDPTIVPVYEFGEHQGQPYIVMR